MEHRIELEQRGRDKLKVTELNLDNCRSTNVVGLDDFKNLRILSLINVGLTTLKGFPVLPELRKLELSDNRISAGVENLVKCPKLTHLSLSGNKIKDFESLDPLKDLKELKSLDLFNCEVTTEKDYRQRLFNLIASLEFLDGTDKDDQEIEDEDEAGVANDEDEEDDDEEEEEEDDDDEDGGEDYGDNEPGLDLLQKDNLSDDEDEGEFEPEDDEDDDEDDINDEEDLEESEIARGQKRKREGEDDD
eukprot:gene19538-21469_t